MFDAEYKKAFGARLTKIRKDRDFSQEALADEADMSRSYLSGVESGDRNVSFLLLCRLALALDVQLSYLVDIDLATEDKGTQRV